MNSRFPACAFNRKAKANCISGNTYQFSLFHRWGTIYFGVWFRGLVAPVTQILILEIWDGPDERGGTELGRLSAGSDIEVEIAVPLWSILWVSPCLSELFLGVAAGPRISSVFSCRFLFPSFSSLFFCLPLPPSILPALVLGLLIVWDQRSQITLCP